MIINKMATGRATPMPVGFSLGVGIGVGVTLILSAFIAYFVQSGSLEESAVGYSSGVILLLSSALGALVSASRIKRRWMLICLGTGGLYYLSLIAMTGLFFGGQYQGMGVTAILVFIGAGLTGLLGAKEKGSGKWKRRKYRHG